jgi:ATP-dependent helicase YprA (DUF1998 family)
VYIYAFDVAYDTARQPISQLLGQPVEQFSMDGSKRSPRQFFFYKPQMRRLRQELFRSILQAIERLRLPTVTSG